jgi:ribonucleoside-triphosphate reductase
VSISELSKFTLVSRYAAHLPEKKRRETWKEITDRQIGMHRNKYEGIISPELIDEVDEAIKKKRILGSQRALQFGGDPILKKNARLYNCCASYCDRLKFFQESFYLLLCGCGVGFSVQHHHINQLPTLQDSRIRGEKGEIKTHIISDDIEGWADSLGVLLSSYFDGEVPFSEYKKSNISFDFSQIREKGSKLSSSNGKAPGPEPLRLALWKIQEILDRCISEGRNKLKPIDAYDIIMHMADAVLSGGVRRSATICLFSIDDEEMAKAKTGNWFSENPQRGRSNNSAVLIRNKTTKEQFDKLLFWVKEFGEPGIYWTDDPDIIPNPCVEIGFYCYYRGESGKLYSGWHFCNLTEINGAKCNTKEDFFYAARMASRLGTLQAGYSYFPYLGEVTERIVKHEALLGVSITGMMDNHDILFDPDNQREAVKIVLEENEKIAAIIGINPAARATCIKPSGTASCLLGTASGIHPHHYTRYFRNVQSNKMEIAFQHFQSVNPSAVEESVWDPNKATAVVTFCVEVPSGAKMKNQLSAIDLLELVKSTYLNWVLPGTRRERCLHPETTHNVSNTINVKAEEWDEVWNYIYENRNYFSGISLLPVTGDKDYAQAPFQAVHTPKEQVNYHGDGVLFASGLIEDLLDAFHNLWTACDVILGIKEFDRNDSLKIMAVERAKRFADKFFDGDIKDMSYCLKDVYNWYRWLELKKDYKPVDYTEMIEEEDNVDYAKDTIACAGGQCAL